MAGRCAVLLSGGLDSSTLLALLTRHGWEVEAIFVDYGQRAVREEREASRRMANRFSSAWSQVVFRGLTGLGDGETRGRNDLLIACALSASSAPFVAIGTHRGSPYRDCSEPHATAWQLLLDNEYEGERRLLAPFLELDKAALLDLASHLSVPFESTRSCDRAGNPCGECPSCIERSLAVACP